MTRILIVDDYADFGRLLVKFLSTQSYECKAATNAAEAIEIGTAFKPDLLIADWKLKDSREGGLEVARALRTVHPDVKVLIMTGSPESHVRTQLGDLVVERVVEKPFNALQIVRELMGSAT
jgi:CheY-like chemotaxis protein